MTVETKEDVQIAVSSGNVFEDLGFEAAQMHALKASIVAEIHGVIKRRRMTQAEAAERFGLSQPDVSKLIRGQFKNYSLERLLRYMSLLGQDVTVSVKPAAGRRPGRVELSRTKATGRPVAA